MKNHELVAMFQHVAIDHYGSPLGNAYANGFLGSLVGQLLEVAPEAQREKVRSFLEITIKRLSEEAA